MLTKIETMEDAKTLSKKMLDDRSATGTEESENNVQLLADALIVYVGGLGGTYDEFNPIDIDGVFESA